MQLFVSNPCVRHVSARGCNADRIKTCFTYRRSPPRLYLHTSSVTLQLVLQRVPLFEFHSWSFAAVFIACVTGAFIVVRL